jgi:Uncharacterized FAD-dependent dehydrogenases
MIRITNIKLRLDENENILIKKIKKHIFRNKIIDYQINKKSVDARDKENILIIYTVDVNIEDEETFLKYNKYKNVNYIEKKEYEKITLNKKESENPVIVGMGPAGLFAALTLVNSGIKPIIMERGAPVEERINDIKEFTEKRILNENSNIQFGEGGAGTFSDGKLTTGTKDKRIAKVFDDFVKFGAPKEIKYLNKPHIGTDILVDVLKNIRKYLIKKGAIIKFHSKLTDIIIENDEIKGIVINNEEKIETNNIILATGHSSRDTFKMLYDNNILLERKPFAIGVRIEHKQEMINKNQYGKYHNHPHLSASDYKLVHHSKNGRSAYSFCVCPGGHVVGATSEKNKVVTNGMSKYKRDNVNINGAILVTIKEEDLKGSHILAGIYMQEEIEEKAFKLGGNNYNAPIQRVEDFLNKKESTKIGSIIPSYTPGVTPTSLDLCLPNYICDTLRDAIVSFDYKIKGFSSKNAILTGVETRSTSPIRIKRNENMECNINGLFPCGEGAGYAGGITSSAVDGIKVAENLIIKYNN